jgi:hypothetical protein
MTVGAQVKQTIASLKGAQATLEAFSSIEQNDVAKAVYSSSAKRIGDIKNSLESRVRELEFEEPQYKGL